jgi:cytochrome b6-f complex iron-sulfur subunit
MLRREFLLDTLNGIIGIWTLLVGIGLGFIGLRYLWPTGKTIASIGEEKVRIPFSEMAEGSAKKIVLRGKAAIVVNSGGKIYALSAICTHLSCIVNWSEKQKQVVCPCHGAVFDLNGNVIAGPAPKPLITYDVKVIEDAVVIG